jgi:hypothetical protein
MLGIMHGLIQLKLPFKRKHCFQIYLLKLKNIFYFKISDMNLKFINLIIQYFIQNSYNSQKIE